MAKFYTRKGDDGYTGLLGEGRIAKYDPRIESVGEIDEASAVLGLARSLCQEAQISSLIKEVQRDLYRIMAEVAATPENAAQFRTIDAVRVEWLESQTDKFSEQITMPNEFILPGDTTSSSVLALARTIVRRAERKITYLVHQNLLENKNLLFYLNRLSSLCFVLEIFEIQAGGQASPSLARKTE